MSIWRVSHCLFAFRYELLERRWKSFGAGLSWILRGAIGLFDGFLGVTLLMVDMAATRIGFFVEKIRPIDFKIVHKFLILTLFEVLIWMLYVNVIVKTF